MTFWKYIFNLYLRFWPITLLTLFGYGAVMVFDALMPAYVAKSLATVVANGRESAFVWLWFVAAALLAVTSFHFFESRNWTLNQALMRRWIHMDLYRQLMWNKNFAEFKKHPPEYYTDAIYNIQDKASSFELLINVPRQFLALVTVFLINAIVFFRASPMVALFVLIPAILTIGYSIYIAICIRDARRRLDASRIDLRKSVADSLGNIRSIRTNFQIQNEFNIIDRKNMQFTSDECEIHKTQWNLIMLPRVLVAICLTGALWFGLNAYFAGKLPLDLLIFMIVSFTSTMGLVERVKHPISNYIEKIASVMHSFDIVYGHATIPNTGHRRIKQVKTIDVEKICFGYDCGDVLHNTSIHIRAGQHIGIRGHSGRGKTTLLNLIVGLYSPQSGTIKINGIPLHELDVANIRHHIFMSVQNAPLMNRSLRDNIKFANPHISDAAMITAAKQAHIHKFIKSLPNGYDTLAGNVGSLMSGGQINRIMLARAFASSADVMLLDEPTAAVDAATEQKIIRTLRRDFRKHTIIIISHNKSVLDAMDTVIELE